MRLIPIALVATISLVIPQPSHGVMQAKAGAKCTKAKSTQTVGNKRFTCIKSGSKLTWSKGVLVPKPITPAPILTQTNPDSVPTIPSEPTSITRQYEISGVQTAMEKVHYVNNIPRAKRILRWPNQTIFGKPEKIVIVYENMTQEAPPCDLSQALCQGPTRVDTKIYFKVLNDGLAEVFTLENLQINSEYNFGVYVVAVEISESEILKLRRPNFLSHNQVD